MSAHKGRNSAFRANNVFPWRWLALGTLVLWFAMMAPGCGGGGGDDGGGSGGGGNGDTVDPPPPAATDTELRQQFIQAIGEGFILPTYTMMEQASDDLLNSVETFCGSPSQGTLATAQEQWRVVAGLWVESELVILGPVSRLKLHEEVDVPRGLHGDADDIERLIAAGGTPRHFTDERGIEGIEYLLFRNMDADSAILAAYDMTDTAGQRRCTYLRVAAEDLHDNIGDILDVWAPGGENYLESWNSAGDGNAPYPAVRDAVQELAKVMEFVLDDLVNVKIAGYKQGARRPWVDQKPESWRSGNSIANIRHRVAAAEMIYLGRHRDTNQDGFGMDDYLRRTGATDLDNDIKDEFETVLGPDGALSALEDLGVTLEEAVDSHPALVVNAEAESRKLLRTLKRRLIVNELGVEFPGFNDQDGD